MKRVCLMVALVAGGAPVLPLTADAAPADAKAAVTLAEARSRIGEVVASSSVVVMRNLMKGLSAADQTKFLADVNKAVKDLPGSSEEKAAKFLALNHAAVVSAQKGNAGALIAEVFATVPPEALTVVSERFASDVLDRAAATKSGMSDARYAEIALDLMKTVNARVATVDNSAVRGAFAINTLVRASNGTPADLADRLIATLPSAEARQMASSEWIPAALGKGRQQSYEPLLASADAGRQPEAEIVLQLAGAQMLDCVLADLNGRAVTGEVRRTAYVDAALSTRLQPVPMLGDGVLGVDLPLPPPQEPRPYPGM